MIGSLEDASFASGSVGQVVYSRNAHGLYTRLRTTPAQPTTGRKTRAQTRWATVNARWSGTLGHSQRVAWNQYAREFRLERPGRPPLQLSGQQTFVRCNMARVLAVMGWIDDPPTTTVQPRWSLPGVNNFVAVGTITVVFDNAESWANESGGAMVVFAGPDRPATHTFFDGPWRRAGLIRGTVPTPPASPGSVSDPFGLSTAFNRWFKARVVRADGRVSTWRRGQFA